MKRKQNSWVLPSLLNSSITAAHSPHMPGVRAKCSNADCCGQCAGHAPQLLCCTGWEGRWAGIYHQCWAEMEGDGTVTSFRALLLMKLLQSVLALHRFRSTDTSVLTSIRGANVDHRSHTTQGGRKSKMAVPWVCVLNHILTTLSWFRSRSMFNHNSAELRKSQRRVCNMSDLSLLHTVSPDPSPLSTKEPYALAAKCLHKQLLLC